MKFLMIVLAIHFVAEMIGNKRKDNSKDADERNKKILHPAEFNTR